MFEKEKDDQNDRTDPNTMASTKVHSPSKEV
jgi:hypothetical protein